MTPNQHHQTCLRFFPLGVRQRQSLGTSLAPDHINCRNISTNPFEQLHQICYRKSGWNLTIALTYAGHHEGHTVRISAHDYECLLSAYDLSHMNILLISVNVDTKIE